MQVDCIAQVFAGTSRGSGYLIAPSLVLTAAHVVSKRSGPIEIRTVNALRNGDHTRLAAELLYLDDDRDVALLRIATQDYCRASRLGILSGPRPVPVDSVGFPDVTLRDGRSDTLGITGDCHPRSGLIYGRLQVRVSSVLTRGPEGWAGLSGAAVFAGSHLVGVMRLVPAGFSGGVLEASAVASWSNDEKPGQLFQSAGVDPITEPIDADAALQFGTADPGAACDRYAKLLLASFRLDGTGLTARGATAHAIAIDRAYAGTRYQVRDGRRPFNDLSKERRLILIGAPGSGKSVTLKRLLPAASQVDGRVPVYIRLAGFASSSDGIAEVTPATFIKAFAARAAQLGVTEATPRMFEELLVRGQLVIALDGFDEIGGRPARERIARAIGQLSDAAPNVTILVASRPAEYEDTPVPKSTVDGVPEFIKAEALPLMGEEGGEFLRVCFDDDGRLWREIRSKEQLREMAQTPLMLTLLAVLGRQSRLPDSLGDILNAIVTTALETWESAKPGRVASSNVAQARRALEGLALAMQQRDTPAAPLTQPQALRAMPGADGELIDWLVNRTGLIARFEERGARTTRALVQFPHLQLQEYLAGCALARGLAAESDAEWAVQRERGTHSAWVEPQVFAAGELSRIEAFDVLERWLGLILPPSETFEQPDSDRYRAALLAARLLGQADAKFLPATEMESRIVDVFSFLETYLYVPEIVQTLTLLLPRESSLQILREIALQTESGLAWFDQSVPSEERDTAREGEVIATSIRALCTYGEPDDAREAVSWAIDSATSFMNMAPWARLAPWVEEFDGADAVRSYLRSLTFGDEWLQQASSSDVYVLLDVIDLTGYPSLCTEFAREGAPREATSPATAGFVKWLELHPDLDGLNLVDGYYDRLRIALEKVGGTKDRVPQVGTEWWRLPMWPDRDSPAAQALRETVVQTPDVAWFVAREIIRNPAYFARARQTWLEIARFSWDRSRRSALIHDMMNDPDDLLAVPLLLDVLGYELPDRWSGEAIVKNLRSRGRVVEVHRRLNAALQDPATTKAHDEILRRLLDISDSSEEA
jgi:hypothetical protein